MPKKLWKGQDILELDVCSLGCSVGPHTVLSLVENYQNKAILHRKKAGELALKALSNSKMDSYHRDYATCAREELAIATVWEEVCLSMLDAFCSIKE